MSVNQVISQLLSEEGYKHVGKMAKTAILTQKASISLSELDQLIKAIGIPSTNGNSTANPCAFVKDAYVYYNQKGKHKLAGYIRQKYVDKNGNPVIP